MVIGFISDLHVKLYKKNSNFLKHIIKSIDDFLKLKSEVLKIEEIDEFIVSRFVNGKIKVDNIK